MINRLPLFAACVGSFTLLCMFSDTSRSQCELSCGGCQDCQHECTRLSAGVTITDADALVGLLFQPITTSFGPLPSDRFAQLAPVATDVSCEATCCSQQQPSGEEEATLAADAVPRQIFVVRNRLADSPNCTLDFDTATFSIYAGHGDVALQSESEIVLAAYANLSGDESPATVRWLDGTAAAGPDVLSRHEAAALRYAADQLDAADSTRKSVGLSYTLENWVSLDGVPLQADPVKSPQRKSEEEAPSSKEPQIAQPPKGSLRR